jgi:hypothetical protein
MLPSALGLAADYRDLKPASDDQFIATLLPCLQLVAPVGMDEDSQDTWFEAARVALDAMPIGLLQRGAAAAMLKADHPAKIVPAIMAEVGDAWERRKRLARPSTQAAAPALPAPGQEYATPDELDAICKQFKVGRYSDHRPAGEPARPTKVEGASGAPSRKPTRADYIRLFGIDPGEPETDQAKAA